MTWQETQWHPPSTDKVRVRFRNGQVSKHTYRAKQLDWRITDKILAIKAYREEI